MSKGKFQFVLIVSPGICSTYLRYIMSKLDTQGNPKAVSDKSWVKFWERIQQPEDSFSLPYGWWKATSSPILYLCTFPVLELAVCLFAADTGFMKCLRRVPDGRKKEKHSPCALCSKSIVSGKVPETLHLMFNL